MKSLIGIVLFVGFIFGLAEWNQSPSRSWRLANQTDGIANIDGISDADATYYATHKADATHQFGASIITSSDGTKEYFYNKKLHREDGPARRWPNGSKQWWINGVLHRTDGPAITHPSGEKKWYINGKLHRTDGPAIINANKTFHVDSTQWWINGVRQ